MSIEKTIGSIESYIGRLSVTCIKFQTIDSYLVDIRRISAITGSAIRTTGLVHRENNHNPAIAPIVPSGRTVSHYYSSNSDQRGKALLRPTQLKITSLEA